MYRTNNLYRWITKKINDITARRNLSERERPAKYLIHDLWEFIYRNDHVRTYVYIYMHTWIHFYARTSFQIFPMTNHSFVSLKVPSFIFRQ